MAQQIVHSEHYHGFSTNSVELLAQFFDTIRFRRDVLHIEISPFYIEKNLNYRVTYYCRSGRVIIGANNG